MSENLVEWLTHQNQHTNRNNLLHHPVKNYGLLRSLRKYISRETSQYHSDFDI